MRRLVVFLLLVACAVKAVPAEHPAHRRAEDVVDAAAATAWEAGTKIAQAARAMLRGDQERRENASANREQSDRAPAVGRAAFCWGAQRPRGYLEFEGRAWNEMPGGFIHAFLPACATAISNRPSNGFAQTAPLLSKHAPREQGDDS